MKYFKLLFIVVFLIFTSCKEASFDEKKLLTDITNTIIVPSVENFVAESNMLNTQVQRFVNDTNEENLIAAQEQWKVTALAYSNIHSYNIGIVRDKFMNLALYNWPTLPAAIENVIRDKEITKDFVTNLSPQIKTLSGLEYLLFNTENKNIISAYLSSEKRRNYLKFVSEYLVLQAERLHDIWVGETNYAATFITNEKTGIKSSFNLLYNGIYNVLDTDKVTKVGKPAGLENSSNIDPETIQAFYSNTSLALIKSNVLSVKRVYFKDNGLGISDYVFAVVGNNDVNNNVATKIDEVIAAIDAIPTNLFDAITNNQNEVKVLHKKLNELVILFGVDVRSALSITITSTDNDGD